MPLDGPLASAPSKRKPRHRATIPVSVQPLLPPPRCRTQPDICRGDKRPLRSGPGLIGTRDDCVLGLLEHIEETQVSQIKSGLNKD